MSRRTSASSPASAAHINGVIPDELVAFTDAPRANASSTHDCCFAIIPSSSNWSPVGPPAAFRSHRSLAGTDITSSASTAQYAAEMIELLRLSKRPDIGRSSLCVPRARPARR
jgi:hypothetical protein